MVQIHKMNTLIYVIASVISLLILYVIIRSAVVSALKKQNDEILNELKVSNRLKVKELNKSGIDIDEIRAEL